VGLKRWQAIGPDLEGGKGQGWRLLDKDRRESSECPGVVTGLWKVDEHFSSLERSSKGKLSCFHYTADFLKEAFIFSQDQKGFGSVTKNKLPAFLESSKCFKFKVCKVLLLWKINYLISLFTCFLILFFFFFLGELCMEK
jgi:hypothetical protein